MDRTDFRALEASPHAVAFPDAEPRVVKLSLAAGEGVDSHQHPGREIVCFVDSGRMEFTLDGETQEVSAGEVVRFDGDQDIAPTAQTDSTAILVLAKRDE